MPTPENSTSLEEAKTILLVDDEPMLLEFTSFSLTAGGYRVLSAGGGPEALETAANESEIIHLIITDSFKGKDS